MKIIIVIKANIGFTMLHRRLPKKKSRFVVYRIDFVPCCICCVFCRGDAKASGLNMDHLVQYVWNGLVMCTCTVSGFDIIISADS